MNTPHIVVVGGGAAGFFAAIAAAETNRLARVTILEKGAEFLTKVRISGGGRCNVTHACFDPRDFATRYPRGAQEMISPLHQFQASDTVAWFAARGVNLKTEGDGRMFPVTNHSQTIVDCLVNAATSAGVNLRTRCGVERATRRPEGGFTLPLSTGETLECDRLLLAMGGCRTGTADHLATQLGHHLEPPVPSLFTFHIATPWLRQLAGVTVETVEATAPGLRERGPLLVTHWGVSGPVILRLSAWGARALQASDYQFPLQINWLPHLNPAGVAAALDACRRQHPAKFIVNTPLAPLPARLWEQLVLAAGVHGTTRWTTLSRAGQQQLARQLSATELPVTGKSLNKEEFVTCGGVRLREVDFKTMQSRLCPGLYFAGELLDIDGITGGFNFQAAWTTGWIAGQALAQT